MLIYAINQAGGNQALLDTADDCFRFVVKFFEPINLSAVHIYHSALELSPLSSVVRRLYYHRRGTPFARVVAGTPSAWDESIHLSRKDYYRSYAWSPCGRFVAAQTLGTVDIRDPLSSEILSTLTPPKADLADQLAYSPDGHSLALLSNISLTILDIQTGGVAKEIKCGNAKNVSLTWSLDGTTICAIFWEADTILELLDQDTDNNCAVHVYDVASGTTSSPGTVQSRGKPHLWAQDTSFRVITVERGDQTFTIETFEVGSVLTKVESFHVKSWGQYNLIIAHDPYFGVGTVEWGGGIQTAQHIAVGTIFTKDKSSRIESWGQCGRVGSFSPTTYRISISNSICNQLRILDIRKSECLLEEFDEDKHFGRSSHCFSSDGSLFAISSMSGVHIWKYTSARYTPWREFPPFTRSSFSHFPPQFSPTSSSILGCHSGPLQVWRLDGSPVAIRPDDRTPFAVLSCCGTYIMTGYTGKNSTITINNLLSPIPSQFIDTDMYVSTLAFTGNVLLVWGGCKLVAWRLTENGSVYGVSAERRAGQGDSIWTVSSPNLRFSVGDQAVITEGEEAVIHVYDTGTGEVLGPAQVSPHPRGHQYSVWEMEWCQHYPHYRNLDKQPIPSEDEWPVKLATLEEGWVRDLEGKHRMWIPLEWRVPDRAGWLHNTTLLLHSKHVPVIIMF